MKIKGGRHSCRRNCSVYRIAGNFNGGNIDGLASFRSLTGEILMDSLLDKLY